MDRATMREMVPRQLAGLTATRICRAFQQQHQRSQVHAFGATSTPTRYRLVETSPLKSPPGVAIADRLMDHQDTMDRAELIERELKLARMGKGDVK